MKPEGRPTGQERGGIPGLPLLPFVDIVFSTTAVLMVVMLVHQMMRQQPEIKPLPRPYLLTCDADVALVFYRPNFPAEQVPVQRLAVGYGEPLYGAHQIEALGILLQDLEKRGYAGTVAVTASLGDFCLTGNPAEGYALAPGEMPANRCDLIGNPAGDLQKSPERLPASLASLIAGVRTRTAGAIDVRVDTARRPAAEVAVPADPSAAQWNAAATARNFVEFTVGPKKSPP
jgi:hypothetical protein